jgi:hypothetical protein
MKRANFSLSFTVEVGEESMQQVTERLDRKLAGQIKDLVAKALNGFEFDLHERYWLFSAETEAAAEAKPRSTQAVPIWLPDKQRTVSVKVGSPDWFQFIGQAKKFSYRYDRLNFTVRWETRKSKGRVYSYWRAYATVNGKLMTKQLGVTEKLTKGALDAVGKHFFERGSTER